MSDESILRHICHTLSSYEMRLLKLNMSNSWLGFLKRLPFVRLKLEYILIHDSIGRKELESFFPRKITFYVQSYIPYGFFEDLFDINANRVSSARVSQISISI